MIKIAVVIGQFRSGTSAVAQVMQRLGIPMAKAIMPPIPPVDQFDWEDLEMAEFYADLFLRPQPITPAMREAFTEWWPEYMVERVQHGLNLARGVGTVIHAVGVKSPMLGLFLRQIRQVAEEKKWDLRVIVAERLEQDRLASIKRVYGPMDSLERVNGLDNMLRPILMGCSRDLTVQLEELQANPRVIVQQLADMFGTSPLWKDYAASVVAAKGGLQSCLG